MFRLIVREADADLALLCRFDGDKRFSVLAAIGVDCDTADVGLVCPADTTIVSELPRDALSGIASQDLAALYLLCLDPGHALVVGWQKTAPAVAELQRLAREAADAFRDLTTLEGRVAQLDRARRRAEEENLAKSRFLASLSHDLRTPLNAIIGFSELVRSDLHGDGLSPRYRAYAEDINASGLHLLALINEILDLSKIAAGKMELHSEDFGCSEILPLCFKAVGRTAAARNILFDTYLPDAGGELRADRRMVKQILVNLLTNAVKLSPDGATVTLRWREDSAGTVIEITDRGTGMTAQEIDAALTPYAEASGPPRRRSGDGLGLLLAASLAGLHGGWLRMTSVPGQGTTRSVFFPADGAPNASIWCAGESGQAG